ncbi:hypothetical protein PV08_04730 [Exophiala spinifera]|uniref:Cupin 2 conserved barrel domain-containing protein n=1 Tax=Exophiala spinifera TaxID=91928 RepID=A0A0D1YQR0_9EURO|nr:uncharacterized protein PV08_04730 [Exophiala spinifera]KIW17536.1 hypothetical protein PV08_04730 [Exophiala spinifera]
MLSFLRPTQPRRTDISKLNPIPFEDGRSVVKFHPPGSSFAMTHTIPPTTPGNGPSILQPPFHYHISQAESFVVRSGRGGFWLGTSAEPFVTLSTDLGQSSTAAIPPKRRHKFENASQTDPLVVDVRLDPEKHDQEQRFFRNFFGYLDDCRKANSAPSLFQLMVFLHAADTPLALPVPNETLAFWVSRAFLIVMAFWGRWMLGYKDSYPEYYETPKSK